MRSHGELTGKTGENCSKGNPPDQSPCSSDRLWNHGGWHCREKVSRHCTKLLQKQTPLSFEFRLRFVSFQVFRYKIRLFSVFLLLFVFSPGFLGDCMSRKIPLCAQSNGKIYKSEKEGKIRSILMFNYSRQSSDWFWWQLRPLVHTSLD